MQHQLKSFDLDSEFLAHFFEYDYAADFLASLGIIFDASVECYNRLQPFGLVGSNFSLQISVHTHSSVKHFDV